jgi:hypothetical protein
MNSILLFDLIDIFNNYGVVFALLILAIIVAFLIIRNSTKRIKEQEGKIDSLYEKIDELMKKLIHDDDHSDLTGKFLNYAENANKIQIQLYHILQNFGANRVSIYEFHNGGTNLQGVEFKKCSNTYEAVALETKPIIKEMQNLPLSMNPLWSKLLATRDNIEIPSVEGLNDVFLKNYLEAQSIKTLYSLLLSDYDNSPIGFITLEYYRTSRILTDDEFDEINDISNKIAVLINLK